MVGLCLQVIGGASVVAAAGALRPAAPVAVADGGVDVGRQVEARSDPVEELEQLRALPCGERVGDRPFVLDDQVESIVEQPLAAPGEIERPNAPVAAIRPALDQPSRLQLVDDRDHSARRDVQPFREHLLRLPVGRLDGTEHSELARMELQRLERAVKPPRDRVAERRQHEADAAGSRVGLARRHRHMIHS
jgi:hypothetical protein